MKKLILNIVLLTVVFILISCKPNNEISQEQINFTENATNFGAYVNGNNTFLYDESVHQIAYDPIDKTFFRIQDDNQSKYCHIDFKDRGKLEVGKIVEITITTKDVSIENSTYSAEVVKAQNDKYWLWCGEKNTGFVTM